MSIRAAVSGALGGGPPLLPGEVDAAEYQWADGKKPWNPRPILRRDTLRQQTEQMADILAKGGFDARGDGMTLVGLVTGHPIPVPGWANLNILPLVAAPKRDQQARESEYYLSRHPKGQYARYAVITGGERVPAFGALGDALAALERRISKMAHDLRKLDVEVVVSALEFTRVRGDERIWGARTKRWGLPLCERDRDRCKTDENYYHPHANLIYISLRQFTKAHWKAILRHIRRRVRAHWRDCGRIEDTRGVCKYPTKPADLLGPDKEISPQEMCWLAGELHRAKLFNPLGDFRAARREWQERRVRIERVTVGVGKTELREVFQVRSAGLRREHVPDERQQCESAGNIILAILAARRHACRIPEPVAVVTDYRPDTWEWLRDCKYAVVADAREAAIDVHARRNLYASRADLERMIAEDQAVLAKARADAAKPPISFTLEPQVSKAAGEGHCSNSPSPADVGPRRRPHANVPRWGRRPELRNGSPQLHERDRALLTRARMCLTTQSQLILNTVPPPFAPPYVVVP